MKNFYSSTSFFSVLALVAFQYQSLQATNNIAQDFSEPIKLETHKLLQDTLLKITSDPLYINKCLTDSSLIFTLEEMKQFEPKLTPDNNLFDSWMALIIIRSYLTDFKDSLKIVKEKGESEFATPAAQYNLGTIYDGYYEDVYNGTLINEDLGKAFVFYRKAAKQGHVIAQNTVGDRYYLGNGVNKNLSKALKWYNKSAEQNNPQTQLSQIGRAHV